MNEIRFSGLTDVFGIDVLTEWLENYLSMYAIAVKRNEVYRMDELEFILNSTRVEATEMFMEGLHAYQYCDDGSKDKQFSLNDDFILIDGYGHFASMSTQEAAEYVLSDKAGVREFIHWLKKEID